MKKICLLIACIAIIIAIFSCSKQQGYLSSAAPHTAQIYNKAPGNNTSVIVGSNYQENVIEGFQENSNSLLGGGDDDKPKVMHRIINPALGPVQNAAVTMINSTDSLQLFTDTYGECIFSLPRLGKWGLKVSLGDVSLLDTSINIIDSFSTRIINVYYQ